MKIVTQNFGEIEISNDDIINFNEGLPGFPDARGFVIMLQEDEDENPSPICFLQSADDEELCFVLTDMTAFLPEYLPLVLVELAKEQLGDFDPDNTIVYNITTINSELTDSTVNLKAPIVISLKKKTGRQFLCSEDFPIRAKLFGLQNKGGCGCNCGGATC